MTTKIKLSEITDMFKDMGDVEALEGVAIEGEIELDINGGGGLNPALAYALGHETAQISGNLTNISRLLSGL